MELSDINVVSYAACYLLNFIGFASLLPCIYLNYLLLKDDTDKVLKVDKQAPNS